MCGTFDQIYAILQESVPYFDAANTHNHFEVSDLIIGHDQVTSLQI